MGPTNYYSVPEAPLTHTQRPPLQSCAVVAWAALCGLLALLWATHSDAAASQHYAATAAPQSAAARPLAAAARHIPAVPRPYAARDRPLTSARRASAPEAAAEAADPAPHHAALLEPSVVVPMTVYVVEMAAALWQGVASLSLSLPALLCVTCLAPTLLGYWKSDLTVSYGYGTGVAASAALIYTLLGAGVAPWITAHCALLVLYGTRLNVFLAYRETFIQFFRDMSARIEANAQTRGPRLSRTPFITGCAFLYFCLVSPLVLSTAWTGFASSTLAPLFKALVAVGYAGWALAAYGDLAKSYAKARGQTIVSGGIFSVVRHPNYTGEQIMWSCNFLAAIVSFAGMGVVSAPQVAWLVLSALGWAGIMFVLVGATTNLEKRQREKYGFSDEYQAWVSSSWAGLTLPKKA